MKLPDNDDCLPIFEACLIGAIAGLSAVLFSSGVTWLGSLRVHLCGSGSQFFVLSVFGLIGGLIAGLLVENVAPEASGSGIPQVKARLDRVMMPLNLRIALVKLLGGIATLGSGLCLGREGPTVQLGAAVAAPLSRLFPTTAAHKRQLIAAGAGAGLTAAFSAPLAGIVFVLEELLREIKPSTIVIATIACATSSYVVNNLFPRHLHTVAHSLADTVSFSSTDLPFYCLLGVVAGVLGAIFNAGILQSLNLNRKFLKTSVAFRISLAGLISGATISFLPSSFHDYAGMRAIIVAGQTDLNTVLLALVGIFVLALVAYGSGAPGGLFAPSLAIGSALGYAIGYFEHALTGTGSTVAFALVGMGAFFSAVARVPLTAMVITFELTSNFAILTPLMLVCVISSAMAEALFKGGLYEHLMHWNGIHLRGPDESKKLQVLKAQDIMQREFETIPSKAPIKEVLAVLGDTAQRGLPVVERGRLVGVVTQSDVLRVNQVDSSTSMTAAQIMTPHPVAVSPHDSLEDILFLFSRYKFVWLPVVLNEKLSGVILESDILKALFSERLNGDATGTSLLETMERQKPTADQDVLAGTITLENTAKQEEQSIGVPQE